MSDEYRSSFGQDEVGQPCPDTDLTAWISAGPTESPTAARGLGFTGLRALGFRHRSAQRTRNTLTIADGLGVAVHADSELRYVLFPASADTDPYAATGIAVDLRFDDGSRLSALGATDSYGTPMTAAAQDASRALVPDQWNRIICPIGKVAAGRVVVAIELSAEHREPDATAQGWIDDLVIARTPRRARVDPAEYVDTRRGTNSSRDYSRGNTIPATAMPNGFNFLTPMTDAMSQKWLYEYARANDELNRPTLQALGLSHQPSPWMGDRNQLAIMPAQVADDGTVRAAPGDRALSFTHDTETARPYEYRVEFDCGIEAAMVPTMHGGCLRFSAPGRVAVVVDQVAGDSKFWTTDDGQLEGWVDGGAVLSTGRSRMYVVGRFDSRPHASTRAPEHPTALVFTFADEVSTVDLRLATSLIGLAQARANLREAEGDYGSIRDAARDAWNDCLGVIELDGANDDQLVTVYSNLYRLNLYPNWQHEHPDGDARRRPYYASPVLEQEPSTDAETGAVVRAGRMAVNHGFWDTYRTVWPAYALLYPSRSAELLDGFLQQHRDSGWIARWSSPGHADLMTGTSADVAFADAILKGVPVAEPFEVYEALLKSATVAPPSDAVGRKGGDVSPFLGYVPADIHESVSWTTENAVNDAGIANLAEHLASLESTSPQRRLRLREEAEYLRHRSRNYRNLFDPAVGFLRQRDRAGAFAPADTFDPEEWGGAYTETNAWTFAFHAPHDGAGLAAMHGGTTSLEARLDEYFATPERADKPGSYPRVIHEMIEARDVRLGQFGLSNQPAHAMPYLYLYAGRPWKTQSLTRDALRRLFRGSDIGQGYPGDEDNGEMSAWYLFTALGFYPLAVGSTRYALGSPLFERARIRLEHGATLTIDAEHQAYDHPFVQAVRFDGETLDTPWIEHGRLSGGGTLTFVMGPEPSAWGAGATGASGATGEPSDFPLRDVATTASVSSDDGISTAALVDDDAGTSVTFTSTHSTLTVRPTMPSTRALFCTITSGDDSAPSAWTLEGKTAAGWTVLDSRSGERFTWHRQTRPFRLASPQACSEYRLRITATANGGPATIAEFELLAAREPEEMR